MASLVGHEDSQDWFGTGQDIAKGLFDEANVDGQLRKLIDLEPRHSEGPGDATIQDPTLPRNTSQ